MPSRTTRADDEMLLDWIAWRIDGHSSAAIAAASGVPAARVRTATNRVWDADEAHCGETENVAEGYWQ